MLYLPPGWGHDGVAEGECMTCSVGFRSPGADALSGDLLQRLADDEDTGMLYRDPLQPASVNPGEIPRRADFARKAGPGDWPGPVRSERALGESLSEPKPRVWFDARDEADLAAGRTPGPPHAHAVRRPSRVHQRESFRIGGRDARLMRQLADAPRPGCPACAALSPGRTPRGASLAGRRLVAAAGERMNDDAPQTPAPPPLSPFDRRPTWPRRHAGCCAGAGASGAATDLAGP